MNKSNGSHTTAYLLIEAPLREAGGVAHTLITKYRQYIPEAHVVWGQSDVIAKVSVPSPAMLAELVMDRIQEKNGPVKQTRTFIAIEGMHHRSAAKINDEKSDAEAFVFINVGAARSGEVAKFLAEDEELAEHILETHAVWGDADVIARISASGLPQLADLIVTKIQNMSQVTVTRTYIIIPGLSEFSGDMKHVYET